MVEWASYYDEIPEALANNENVRSNVIELIPEEPILGKSLEGGTRKDDFRGILTDFLGGTIDHETAEQRVLQELPPAESPYRGNNNVFNRQWINRLVRSQTSRFYNQSVMEIIENRDNSECFVPHSPDEYSNTACTQQLAGETCRVSELLRFLYSQQRQGNWDDGVTIPGHANCTHTVVPVSD
jgi:hypothetical protein